MRTFLLRNGPLTSCGASSGNGQGGIAYFCPACGEIWGRVKLGTSEWAPATVPCSLPCGVGRGYHIPGSFLRILSWWDTRNGITIADQLNNADSALLHYEAERHIDWKLNGTPHTS